MVADLFHILCREGIAVCDGTVGKKIAVELCGGTRRSADEKRRLAGAHEFGVCRQNVRYVFSDLTHFLIRREWVFFCAGSEFFHQHDATDGETDHGKDLFPLKMHDLRTAAAHIDEKPSGCFGEAVTDGGMVIGCFHFAADDVDIDAKPHFDVLYDSFAIGKTAQRRCCEGGKAIAGEAVCARQKFTQNGKKLADAVVCQRAILGVGGKTQHTAYGKHGRKCARFGIDIVNIHAHTVCADIHNGIFEDFFIQLKHESASFRCQIFSHKVHYTQNAAKLQEVFEKSIDLTEMGKSGILDIE